MDQEPLLIELGMTRSSVPMFIDATSLVPCGSQPPIPRLAV